MEESLRKGVEPIYSLWCLHVIDAGNHGGSGGSLKPGGFGVNSAVFTNVCALEQMFCCRNRLRQHFVIFPDGEEMGKAEVPSGDRDMAGGGYFS